MEREVGEGREVRGRRGGLEKMRGIIVGGMVLGLLMGCNNGGEDPQKVFLKSVVSLGNDFLNVFTSFGDMLGDVLGFSEKTTKSEVGTYFNKIKETVQRTKEQLNTMVENMKAENNPNASKTEAAVKTLDEKLTKVIEGAKTVSEAIGDAKEPLGDIALQSSPAGAKGDVENLIKGIKGIVEVVLKEGGDSDAGDDKKAADLGVRTGGKTTAGEAGKLFDAANAGDETNLKKSAADAAKSVGAVTGSDILRAMIKAGGDAIKLADGTVQASTAKKDATIAGAMALRAMAKGGKFAGPNDRDNSDAKKTLEGASKSAVIKVLGTLTIAIRKTIDEGLKEVKEAIKINPDDTPVTTEAKN